MATARESENQFRPKLWIFVAGFKHSAGCLHGRVIENDCTCNPLTLCSVCVLVHVQVWVHILDGPQCSAEERYNNTVQAVSTASLFN